MIILGVYLAQEQNFNYFISHSQIPPRLRSNHFPKSHFLFHSPDLQGFQRPGLAQYPQEQPPQPPPPKPGNNPKGIVRQKNKVGGGQAMKEVDFWSHAFGSDPLTATLAIEFHELDS